MSKIFGISDLPVSKPFESALEFGQQVKIKQPEIKLPKKGLVTDVFVPKDISSKSKSVIAKNIKKIIK